MSYHPSAAPRKIILFLILLIIARLSDAQPYVNGNLSTGVFASNGTAAPSGYSWSQAQSPNTTLGFPVGVNTGISAVDDFTVPTGQIWNISSLTCFAYCSGYTGATAPYNDMRMQIFSSDPAIGTPAPVFGNLGTNRFSLSNSAQIYRIGATTNTSRLVYASTANISITLNPGHYWVEWQIGAAPGISGNSTPPSTVAGTITQPGNNARLHNTVTGVWSDLVDGTTGARQDFPFAINYTVTIPPPCTGTPDPGNTISSDAIVCAGSNFSLSLQNNPLVSGLSFQWQSSADGISWANIPGYINNTATLSQTAATYYRALVSCGGSNNYSNALLVPVYYSGVTAQPADAITVCGSRTLFSAGISGNSPVLSYQWEQKTSPSNPWTRMANSPAIKGVNDDSLLLMQPPASWNGYLFRLLFTDACGIIHASDSTLLTVDPFAPAINPASANVCQGQVQALNVAGEQTRIGTFSSPALSLLIPDTLKAGATDSLSVSGIPSNATMLGLSVKLNIAHTWAGDLAMALKSPNGKIINLNYYLSETGGPGTTTTGFTNTIIGSNGSVSLGDSADPWTGYFKADGMINAPGSAFPAGPLSVTPNTTRWDSLWLQPNGSWKLGLYDGGEGDEGTLTGWSLQFTYSVPVESSWSSSAAGTLFSDAAATLPYAPGSLSSTVYAKTNSSLLITANTTSSFCGPANPATAAITVGAPTGSITGPADVLVCPGNNANFSAVVSSGTGLTYQWQLSTDGGTSWTNIPGADAAGYSIAAVTAADNNKRFRVLVSNPCSSPVFSSVSLLTVGAGPNILQQPSNTIACIGGNASLSATVSGTGGSFQWQVSIDGGASWSNITSGGNTSVLNLTGLSAADNNNRYRVLVTDCGITVPSDAAVLNVVPAGSISMQPANVAACEGSDAVFMVTATGSSYQWQISTDNGVSWTDISGANSTTLNISAVTTSLNNNQYRLIVGDCGTGTLTTNPALLSVKTPAVITTQPSPVTVCEGGEARFSATATGSPLSLQWQVSSDGGITWVNIPGAGASEYIIAAAGAGDSNKRYRVKAGTGLPCNSIYSDAALLTVNSIPDVTATVNPGTEVCAGTSITLTATGAASYSWSGNVSNGVSFPANASDIFTVTGTRNGCSDTAVISITVYPNPSVTVSASNGTRLLPGGSTVLTAASNPAAVSFRWFRNGTLIPAGSSGSSITITYNSANDLGSYAAEATDGNGCRGTSDGTDISASAISLITPNPAASGYFYVNLSPGGSGLSRTVNVFDNKGARVISVSFHGSSAAMKIPAAGLAAGIYCVQVLDEQGRSVARGKVLIARD